MNSSKKKKIIFNIIYILAIIVLLAVFLIIDFNCSKKTSIIVSLCILAICILIYIITKVREKQKEIKIPIKSKIKALDKLYKIFDIENNNNLVLLNTSIKEIAYNIQEKHKEVKVIEHQNNNYSILIADKELKSLKKLLKEYDPDRIIIHQYYKGKQSAKDTLSICIENEVIIQYPKNSIPKEEIKKIIEIIKESK